MHGCRCASAFLLVVLLSLLLTPTTGRRGCLKFGHSCLGAHGKRSGFRREVVADFLPVREDTLRLDLESDESVSQEERSNYRKRAETWRDMVISALQAEDWNDSA